MSLIRQAEIERKTNETEISIFLNIDGKGKSEIDTGIPFEIFNYYLDLNFEYVTHYKFAWGSSLLLNHLSINLYLD